MYDVDIEIGVMNLVVYGARKVHECWYLRKLEFQVIGKYVPWYKPSAKTVVIVPISQDGIAYWGTEDVAQYSLRVDCYWRMPVFYTIQV